MSKRVVIVDGIRTPFVRAGDRLREVPAWELGRAATRELLARTALAPGKVDEVIFGCVAQPSDSANIARVVALRAGIPETVPALTVGRNCGSGMEAVTHAAERILAGAAEVVIAGGVESMSRIPLQYPLSFSWKMASIMRARSFVEKVLALTAVRLRDLKPVIALEEGLTDLVSGDIMGLTAERLAREFGITREQQDAFALASHEKALAAAALLAEEQMLLGVAPHFADLVDGDVGPRDSLDIAKLARLRPYFDRRQGTVTVGNSCQLTDGAVALLLMEEDRARQEGVPILGRLVSHAYAGCDPARMGLGPVYASRPALRAAGLELSDLRLIEINEAFSAQVLACLEAFESERFAAAAGWARPLGVVDRERLNVHGGAIALGHPVGATGARLILTALKELQRRGGGFGLATLCIGGGQGGAVVVEGMAA